MTRRRGRAWATTQIRKTVLFVRAFAAVLHIRLMLTLRRSTQLRARVDRLAAAGRAAPSDLREVAWSVRAAARLVPGATCLTQAHAGQSLLARRGFASIVRLSVPRDAAQGFRPHAWLIAQDVIVLGGTPDEYERHHPLVDFGGRAAGAGP